MKILLLGPPVYKRAFLNVAEDIEFHDAMYSLPVEVTPETVDFAVFTGGADVSPHLYGESPRPETNTDPRRDFREKHLFDTLKRRNIPMVGICRGAQFLNVMNGGKMNQHVERHTAPHRMKLNMMLGEMPNEIQVNSTHHQMMEVPKNGQVLAYTSDLAFKGETVEPEVVFFPETKSLCVQYHPEMLGFDSNGYEYFNLLIKEMICDVNV